MTYPQQPGQPQGPWPPQPPKSNTGRTVAITLASVFGGLILLAGGCTALVIAGSSDDTGNKGYKPTAEKPKTDSKENSDTTKNRKDIKPKTVTFKVWGNAANGVDVNYGSDNDSRAGKFKNGKFETTLPLNKDSMFYNVIGQLQGGGDIQCSVTIGGKTRTAHASGDYNICDAQLNSDFVGGWD